MKATRLNKNAVEITYGRFFQTAEQMMVLQLEYVFLSVIFIKVHPGLLGRQSGFGGLLFADERGARRGLRYPYPSQPRFL